MSGPALRKADSHSSIHEAALNEAREITEVLEGLLEKGHDEKALEAAYIGVEHWESRTLQHAASEEEGLYKEIAEESPEMREAIIGLTRDHEILRLLVQEIKDRLVSVGVDDHVLQRFQALILVDELHNQAEERILPEH